MRRAPAPAATLLHDLSRLRAEAAEQIERLLIFLDRTELDDDLEPDADDEDGHDVEECDWRVGVAI